MRVRFWGTRGSIATPGPGTKHPLGADVEEYFAETFHHESNPALGLLF